ncbi:hypothetical protein QAD02_008872 [Eretmocerus hayati]|uniref:Uncharacterized protein n=1 Tax=Eretmocerus hayati TaxID=131215 RepID=A0ACC2N7N7_9HYME|nr:hypothetical protein QAD02_008872 [Eretmocerus hayati]
MTQTLFLSWIVWSIAVSALPLLLHVHENSSTWTSITRHLDQLTAPLVISFPQTTNNHTITTGTTPDLLYILDTIQGLRLEPGSCMITSEGLYQRRNPRRVTPLRDGLLIIWFLSEDYDRERRHSGEWRLLLVDYFQSAPEYETRDKKSCPRVVAELRLTDLLDIVDVLPNRNRKGFDLVLGERGNLPGEGLISVIRYDEQAQLQRQFDQNRNKMVIPRRVQLPGMDFHPFYTPKTVHIHLLNEPDPENGYFLVQIIPQANLLIVKRLNSNFEPIKSRTLQHSKHLEYTFDPYSADHGRFTICTFNGGSRRSFSCLILDSMLNKKVKMNIKPTELASSSSPIVHLRVRNLSNGGVLMAFASKADRRSGSFIYAQQVDSHGSSSETKIIGLVSCIIHEISIIPTDDFGEVAESRLIKMVVLSSVLAISVLLIHVKADVHKIALENVTHIVSGSFYPPTVLKLRNHLVYVSYLKEYDNIYMKIESSEILNNNNRSCEATISVPSERQFSPAVTKILGNEKLIVAFVEKDPDNTEGYKKLDDPVENYTEPIVRFNIIDFYDNCSFVNFTDQFDNGVLESYVPFTIVPYQDSFDILAKSGLHCKTNGSLCVIRYGDKGYKEMVRELDFDTVGINPAFESLHSLYEFDSTDGYVYASTQKLKLLKLDSNLKTVKEYSFKDSLLLALSILNGDVGLCFYVWTVQARYALFTGFRSYEFEFLCQLLKGLVPRVALEEELADVVVQNFSP